LVDNLKVRSLQATVTLEYQNEKIAEVIAQAVSPDNFKVPVGLQVKTVRENSKVITQIQCEDKLTTFIATIDDLLFSVSTAEKTLHAITKKEQ
jgi:tRNA threonylcarbamoyladenosine modification (KEOPS) complex  Pcc1 subunit